MFLGFFRSLPICGFLCFLTSEAASARLLLRAMWLVVVDLEIVGPLPGLFLLLVSGPMGWEVGVEWA